jgi:hypothetical protein
MNIKSDNIKILNIVMTYIQYYTYGMTNICTHIQIYEYYTVGYSKIEDTKPEYG